MILQWLSSMVTRFMNTPIRKRENIKAGALWSTIGADQKYAIFY